jgi:hypothetical protein
MSATEKSRPSTQTARPDLAQTVPGDSLCAPRAAAGSGLPIRCGLDSLSGHGIQKTCARPPGGSRRERIYQRRLRDRLSRKAPSDAPYFAEELRSLVNDVGKPWSRTASARLCVSESSWRTFMYTRQDWLGAIAMRFQ